MELIQFRKDERQKPVEGHPWHITQRYYVTQYRQRKVIEGTRGFSGHPVPSLYVVSDIWTEWQDMP